MTEETLSPRQVAEELGVTARTVQRWIAGGRLPAVRIGGRVRVSRSSLAAVSDRPASGNVRPIRSLLIANRGEIAVRIARTAQRLGVPAIGVHADDERPPDGVHDATAIGSYLDASEIVAAAERTGADAVHPGYGFLAESAGFAHAVLEAGLAWVGPPPAAIAAMGNKAAARQRAAEQGVATVPGYDGEDQDDATLAAEAERIGWPLLVKPSAGGGGKGMRVVTSAAELGEALVAARREARRAFADDRLILERYLAGARHVEIQVLFDAHGAGVHLGERDCSTQRRNQKVVEETPAPSVTSELRARMGAAALAVASAVGYVSAGTVEMLLTDDGEFFFLEMNTRLQVEHAVTELVAGRDLVADQLCIAEGATLGSLGLRDTPPLRGHAIEARLYAEDPEAGFLPATGRLALVRWPEGVRVDTGAREGDVVSERYDPMLAKLIVHAPSREEALGRLAQALDATVVLGVRSNLRFLRWLLAQPPMREGQMRTDTLAGLELPAPPAPDESQWQAAALALSEPTTDPWSGGWRLNGPPRRRVECGEETRTVELPTKPGPATVSAARDGASVHVDVDGQSTEFRLPPPPTVEEALRHATAHDATGSASLVAPMPGRVIAVRAATGDEVRARQPIIVIEAMKMEHAVTAPIDGVLAVLEVAEGDQVERGARLGEVTPYHADHG